MKAFAKRGAALVHARRKPADAVRRYGVLVGSVVDGFESPDATSPHYEIRVDGGVDYRIAVNVQSVDGSEVLAYFDPKFAGAGTLDLTPLLNGALGFQPLQTGPAGSGGLDYLRDNLFPIASMRPIPAAGSGVSLTNLLDANIERAKADPSAMVIAFGEFFEDPGQVDKYFGFGDPSSNQVTTLESQMIHMFQELFGQTVRAIRRQVWQTTITLLSTFSPELRTASPFPYRAAATARWRFTSGRFGA